MEGLKETYVKITKTTYTRIVIKPLKTFTLMFNLTKGAFHFA